MSQWEEFDAWYAEHGWKYVSSREGAFVVWKAAADTLRQRVAELEKELGDFESDIDTCTQHNVELQLEVTKLTAERDELNNIAENIGDLHHVTLDEWAAMKAERDALKQQRDELLAALERSLESFEYIAKYGNSCGHSQLRIPDLKAAIASVKEKQNGA